MASFADIWFLFLSLSAGMFAVYSNFYMVGFVMNLQMPQIFIMSTIDAESEGFNLPPLITTPLWNNILILLIFGIHHSGIIRGPVKRMVRMVLSESGSRVFTVVSYSLYVVLMCLVWTPMPYVLWDIQQDQVKIVIYVLSGVCWSGVAVSLTTLDPLSLLGLRAPLENILKWEKPEAHFVTTGIYGLVRHPTYSFLMLSYWITPKMTIGHLLFSTILSAYILVAVAQFEEPDLVKKIGPMYVEYMKKTPRYIPNFIKRDKTE